MRYFLHRFLQFAIVFFLVTFGVMVFMRIGMNKPGDPALTMLGGTPGGDAYTFREHRAMLTEAGFTDVTAHPLPGFETVILASR